MSRRPKFHRKHMLAPLAIALSCMGCTDSTGVTTLPPRIPALLATVTCSVDVGSANVVCTEASPEGTGGPSLALLGTNQVKMRSANGISDSIANTFSTEVTVQNLLTVPIGTPDGTVKTGLKVFFETGPTATAYYTPGDTGTVTVGNADGYQSFTRAQQAYHFYDTILAPQEITSFKRWVFNVPKTVSRFGFTVRVFTATPTEDRVPIAAPNVKPAWFYDPAYSVRCGSLLMGNCLRNVILLDFKRTATQEERQSAVDAVGGRVVGGQIGLYFVEVPTTDTAYVTNLSNRAKQLRLLPQVRAASPYLTNTPVPDHLSPYDSAGWRQWRLDPDSADQENWALERIAAPLAWGCSTGDTTTTIAVVDRGFHNVPDVIRNTTYVEGLGTAPVTSFHGTAVAGVLGARGNDSTGIVGAMWRTRLRLYDLSVGTGLTGDWLDVWNEILEAGIAGARVINVSQGYSWPLGLNPDTLSNINDRRARDSLISTEYFGFRTAMDSLARRQIRPLVVFSAGNTGIDARWNAARIAVDSATFDGQPMSVLVAGSSDTTNALSWFSNRGTLVRVVAPGNGVYVLNGSGVVVRDSGTSYAAPLVAGVAGLLFSFDPTLTAGQVRQYIIDGAAAGNRGVGGIRILNARESLRLSARRVGAPLCGNRLWFQDGFLRAQRDGQNEPLIAQPATSYGVAPVHGGRKLKVAEARRVVTYEYQGGRWVESPIVERFWTSDNAGTAQSVVARSHNGDSLAVVRTYSSRFEVGVETRDGVFHSLNNSIVRGGSSVADTLCVAERVDPENGNWCIHAVPSNERATSYDFSVSYSPLGDEILLSVFPYSSSREIKEWYPCSARSAGATLIGFEVEAADRCRDLKFSSAAGRAEIFGVRTRDGGLRTVPALGTSTVRFVGISEDGREAAVFDQSTSSNETYGWRVNEITESDGTVRRIMMWDRIQSGGGTVCTLRYRDLRSGAESLSAPCPDLYSAYFTPFSGDRSPASH